MSPVPPEIPHIYKRGYLYSEIDPPQAAGRASLYGNKFYSFDNLHDIHFTIASGRDMCVATFVARLSKEKYMFPDYPLCAETLEPLACSIRKLPKDSHFADEGFPGLKIGNFSVC